MTMILSTCAVSVQNRSVGEGCQTGWVDIFSPWHAMPVMVSGIK